MQKHYIVTFDYKYSEEQGGLYNSNLLSGRNLEKKILIRKKVEMKLITLLPFCIVNIMIVASDNWATYPQVPKTASINGFADPIYSDLPTCAQYCVEASTGNTPCPYWDTGCLCIMPQWSGQVGECIASKCSGDEVKTATSLAFSLCSSVGANKWMMPASISTELKEAAASDGNSKSTSSSSEVTLTSDADSKSSFAQTTDGVTSLSSSSASAMDSRNLTSEHPSSVTSATRSSSASDGSSSTDISAESTSENFAGSLYKKGRVLELVCAYIFSFYV